MFNFFFFFFQAEDGIRDLTVTGVQTCALPILQQPDLSPRELACHITDQARFTVSEATVYRVLKQYGLNRTISLMGFPASKEFRVKTTAPNQMWQSDASYFFVVSWGWYYSIEVLDDYSRFVLASDLKPDMTADSISDVVEQAIAFTGMRQVPIEDRTRLLSESWLGLSGARLRGLSARVGHPAHLLRPASSPDQWQDRALP